MTDFSSDERRGFTFDVSKPNVARVYDYFLGGKDNFAADREFAQAAMQIAPKAPLSALNNREFLGRVVRFLVGEAGITQLLDIGSGLPTRGQRQRGAHALNPACASCTSTMTRSSTRTARRC